MHDRQCPQIGRRYHGYRITMMNKADISLQCKSNVELEIDLEVWYNDRQCPQIGRRYGMNDE